MPVPRDERQRGATRATALLRDDATQRIERAARAVELLHGVVVRAEDEAQLLDQACDALVESGLCVMAWVTFREHGEAGSLDAVARAGVSGATLAAVRSSWADSGIDPTEAAIRTVKPVVIRDVRVPAVPDSGDGREQAREEEFGSVCALPLRLADDVLGALTVVDADRDAFDAAAVTLLSQLANHFALAVRALRERREWAHSAQRLRLVDRALRTLSAGNRVLLRCVEEAELLSEMCRCIVATGGYRVAWVGYARHDERKTIFPMAHSGLDLGILDELDLTWADTPAGQIPPAVAIRTGRPCVRRDFATDPMLAAWREKAEELGYAAVSSFPLILDGEVIGCIDIVAGERDAFDDDELRVLDELATDLSFGVATLRIRARNREAERTIERMAFHDPLTGLPNTTRLRERLEREIERARVQHQPLAFLTLNVDRFREINEALGYRQGDALLAELAERLRRRTPTAAVLARLAVDEFGILLPGAGAERAEATARDLTTVFDEPFELAGTRVEARASIGISLFPGHGQEAEQLILRSDAAMYQAKRSRSGIAVYRGNSEPENRARLSLVADLRRAIDTDQLRLYCQPKVDISGETLCGAEALVRWLHPERGLIPPDRFIPLAEQTGLINALTYWVANAALSQCYAWREAGFDLPLAVNLSARNLLDPRFLDRLAGLLTTWGAEPAWLQFELTESALMEDPVGALAILHRLNKMGFPLVIDDFGTGYSSLSYLQRLPIDAVKIDKSFVLAMPSDPDSGVIVRSTIEMVHNIGLKVVAEGTENRNIWNQLAALGADIAQGTYISEPMPSDSFQAWRSHAPWHSAIAH